MLEAGRPVAPQTPADGPHGVDDPDGPIVGGAAELPILSRKPHTLPVYKRLRGEWAARFAVLALACSIFLPNLGSFGLWDPWETHYGEVTRYMLETGDWVHPWWGYKGAKLGDEKGPGEHFYSKPILLFWMEAATIKTIGLSEMAVRFPVALIAMLAMMAVYFCFSKLWGRPRGFFAALVLATCPQFTMLARQSQTDMPFVGTLTIAFSFFMLALFGKREKTSDKRMWAVLCVTILGVLALVLPQLGIVIADVNHEIPARPDGRPGGLWLQWRNTGWMQAATFLAVLLPLVLSMIQPAVANWKSNNGRFDDGFKDQLRRRCYLWIFYAFCGLSLMGKGLMGFMLPGAIIFVYLLLTNEWTLLVQPYKGGWRGRVELLRGIGIFLCVGLPWYIALLAGPEGTAFWNRFFIHDHFNRLGSGVHAIDDGSFEHFLKWLGYGMWPWIMLMPWALLRLWRIKLADRSPE
ncbi:MAG: 4-amino-4-deoxy-L-arabinose transferase-like glycosyltransferase, partial [Myxococcota bacterium]